MNQRSATPNVLKVGDRQCRIIHLNSFWIQCAVINTTFSPLKMFHLLTENTHKFSRDDKTCWDNTQTACPLGCLTWCPLVLKRERAFLCFLQGRLAKFKCIIYSSKYKQIRTLSWCVGASLLLCQTLCESMDCSPPGSSVLGILQARILEWVAMPSSRGSFWPWDRTYVVLYHQHLHFSWSGDSLCCKTARFLSEFQSYWGVKTKFSECTK